MKQSPVIPTTVPIMINKQFNRIESPVILQMKIAAPNIVVYIQSQISNATSID